MRKLLVAASVLLLTAGMALAQEEDTEVNLDDEPSDIVIEANPDVDYETDNYVGVTLGYPFAFNYGFEELLGDGTDLRLQATSYFYNFTIGADVLFDLAQLEDVIQIYGGGGVAVGSTFVGGFNATVSGLVGGEYRFNEQLGVFLEAGAGFSVIPAPVFSPRGGIGVNYHF